MSEDGCEVAIVDLRLDEEEYECAFATLSADERARARKVQSEGKRRRFVAARAAARGRLARELGIGAERVRLRTGEGGKPELDHRHTEDARELDRARATREPPRFSVSHSGDVAAIAIRRGGEVGVDVERVRAERRGDGRSEGDRRIEWERLLERVCGEGEREEARGDVERVGARIAVHERWVEKEAAVKALGCGLRISPARVKLSRGTGTFEIAGPCGAQERGIARGTLVKLDAPPGYVGAIALVGGTGDGQSVEGGYLLAG